MQKRIFRIIYSVFTAALLCTSPARAFAAEQQDTMPSVEETSSSTEDGEAVVPIWLNDTLLHSTAGKIKDNTVNFVMNVEGTDYRLELFFPTAAGIPAVTLVSGNGEIITNNSAEGDGVVGLFKTPREINDNTTLYAIRLVGENTLGKWSCTVNFNETPDTFLAVYTDSPAETLYLSSEGRCEITGILTWIFSSAEEATEFILAMNTTDEMDISDQPAQEESSGSMQTLGEFKVLLLLPAILIGYIVMTAKSKAKAKKKEAGSTIQRDKKKYAEERRLQEIEEMRAVLVAHDAEYIDDPEMINEELQPRAFSGDIFSAEDVSNDDDEEILSAEDIENTSDDEKYESFAEQEETNQEIENSAPVVINQAEDMRNVSDDHSPSWMKVSDDDEDDLF